jgi:hypothetical protein
MFLVVVVAACGSSTLSSAATGACLADGRAPGVYPELERLVGERRLQDSPDAFATIVPTTIDSGRNCSATALGTLVSHGVTELHFAGATWDEGDGNAMVSAILAVPDGAPPLAPAWVEEFYEAGARAGKHTENIETSRPTMDSVGPVYRLDTLNDLSLQTVVVWPAAEGIRVVIVTTNVTPDSSRAEHDRRVVEGVEGRSLQPSSS